MNRYLILALLICLTACNPSTNSKPTSENSNSGSLSLKSSTPTLTVIHPSPTAALHISSTMIPLNVTGTLIPSAITQEKVNVFGITMYTLNPAGGMLQIAGKGTVWTRRDVVWSAIEPEPGNRVWDSNYDQEIMASTRLGIQPILILESTPQWALKAGFNCGAVAEDKLPALGQFAFDLVKRYSAPPYNVKYWELWNEPDAANFLGCWGDPSDTNFYGGYYYGQMLKTVYPQMKAADPQAQVLVGGLLLDCDPANPPAGRTCVESQFLRGILENEAGDFFDGVAFHGYDYFSGKGTYSNLNWHSASNTTGPVTIAKARYLKGLLGQYGQGLKYLVSTEAGVFYGPYNPSILCSSDAPPDVEVTKAYYLIHSYAAAIAEGWKANIWYSAFGLRCSGLLKKDLSALPAFYAYQFAAQKLNDAQFVKEISDFPGVKGYEFLAGGKRLWVIWSLDGGVHSINLDVKPLLVHRIGEDGKPVAEDNSSTLTIDLSPRFIVFMK